MRILVYLLLIVVINVPAYAQTPTTTLQSAAQRVLDQLDHDSLTAIHARTAIVHWYAENRDYRNALEQTGELSRNEGLQSMALIVRSALKARDTDTANKIMTEVLAVIEKEKDDDDSPEANTVLFSELAIENNNLTLAARFISLLEEGSIKKSRSFLKLAKAHSKANNREEAVAYIERALAQTIGFDEDEKSNVIEIIVEAAKVIAEAGDLERARGLARKALADLAAQSQRDTNDQLYLVTAFALAGEFPQALAIVESMDEGKISGLTTLSLLCKDTNMARTLLDRARLSLAETSEKSSESIDVSNLVRLYLSANRTDEAIELLPKVTDPYSRLHAAIPIADILKERGRTDAAEDVLDKTMKVLEKIISEKSEDIPSTASGSDAKTKSQTLTLLTENYISLGSLDRAELAAKAIDHPQYRASALSKVALGYSGKHELLKARETLLRALEVSAKAKEYNHDRLPEEALFDISCAMSKVGLQSEFATAVNRFLEQLEKSKLVDQFAAHLFILGDLAESSGTTLKPNSVALLKRIEAQVGN